MTNSVFSDYILSMTKCVHTPHIVYTNAYHDDSWVEFNNARSLLDANSTFDIKKKEE